MNRYVLFLLPFLLVCQLSLAQQQTEEDSITVSVEAIQNLQAEFNKLSNKVTIQDSIIAEQADQIQLWQKKARQDSVLLALSNEQQDVLRERMEIRDERIQKLEDKNLWLRIRGYVWTAGGIVIGFLAGSL